MGRLTNEQINNYYNEALTFFNKEYPQFNCQIIDNTLVVGYKWKDSTNLSGINTANEVLSYRCVVKILPDGKFLTNDVILNKTVLNSISEVKFSSTGFSGKIWNYTKEVNIGKNNESGEKEINTYEFCTSEVQKPVKQYFLSLGLKPKFYSYKLNIKCLPPEGKGVSIALPLIEGFVFFILCVVLSHEDLFFSLIVGFSAFILLLWGFINLAIVLSKD